MSRTYRKIMEWKYDAYGRLWTWDELDEAGLGGRYVHVPCTVPDPIPSYLADYCKEWRIVAGTPGYRTVYITPGIKGRDVLNRRGRDKKPWNKPPKWFKQMHRRIERARMRDALALGKPLPVFKRSDEWDWT